MSFSNKLDSMSNNVYSVEPILETQPHLQTQQPVDEFVISDKYIWYDDYLDDSCSIINDNKTIIIDNNQTSLTQEKNSQVIPFLMNRYYDGIDLMNMTLSVHFINSNNNEATFPVCNVSYSTDKIKFYFLVPDIATSVAGNIKLEIMATGTTAAGDYVWRTKPNNEINIIESLSGNGVIEPNDGWEVWIELINQKVNLAQQYADEARIEADNVRDKLDNTIDIITDEVYQSINEELVRVLSNYTSKEEVTQMIQNIDLSETIETIQEQINNVHDLSYLSIGSNYNDGIITINLYDNFSDNPILLSSTTLDISSPASSFISAVNTSIENKLSNVNNNINANSESINNLVSEIQDINNEFQNYYTSTEIDEALSNVTTSEAFNTIKADVNKLKTDVSANTDNITTLSGTVEQLSNALNGINTENNGYTYYATYGTATIRNELGEEVETENVYRLYQVDKDENEEVVSQFVIKGGSGEGGSSVTTTTTLERVTPSPTIISASDPLSLQFNYSSIASDGSTVDAVATWKIGSRIIANNVVVSQGLNTFDIREFVGIGTQKVTLTVTNDEGAVHSRNWTIQVVDVNITSTFNDSYTYEGDVSFTYTPIGSINKTVHFVLDGEEIGTVDTSVSGIPLTYVIPARENGSYLLDVYITANITGNEGDNIETQHIYKSIMWYSNATEPVIGCQYEYLNEEYSNNINVSEYDIFNIKYYVFDPATETPTVTLNTYTINGEERVLVSSTTETMATNEAIWSFKTASSGIYELEIVCKGTTHTMRAIVSQLGINISPILANLALDFNPVGMSNNNAENRNRFTWKNLNGDIETMNYTVSDNFDWVNGGFQIDENGNQYFSVKAGTTATIDYHMFADDSFKRNGKEFKIVFMTENVSDASATWLDCMSDNGIGLKMNMHAAYIGSNLEQLYAPYSEEDIIEFEFNLNTIDPANDSATSILMSYEDGVALRPMIFNNTHSFVQPENQFKKIVLGSQNCDLRIYRIKAYNKNLDDSSILSNFIADARTADEIISRYRRNQIYNDSGILTPESVADACPNLRIIKIECPHFTNDKKDYVKGTNVECIYRNGDPTLDNWRFDNIYHAGQGTTSNEYGYAGRNIDLIMGHDGVHTVTSKIPVESDYVTVLTLGDGSQVKDGTGKISLTRNSVPNDWFNIKVNIASSENANNALLQKRFNDFLPYKSVAMENNPKVKNTMEFVNCVIFVKEYDTNISNHREFSDTEWHFYALGNIGDSKKTDHTRVNDVSDLKEFVVENCDNTLPNSTFQTGVYDENGVVYPITMEQWSGTSGYEQVTEQDRLIADNLPIYYELINGEYVLTSDKAIDPDKTYYRVVYNNPAYRALYVDEYKLSSSGKVSQLSGWDNSFEFRYDMGGNTRDGVVSATDDEQDAQRLLNKDVFRDLYTWIITSSDVEFKEHLKDWFIEESVLYHYLFTERYTMIDNRAKNTFYHYGRCKDGKYRFDFYNYDDDTGLGINNSGELTMTYGKEDIDYRTDGVPSSGYVFNGADTVLWRRVRKLFQSELATLYQTLDDNLCWSPEGLIQEFDAWQEQFPEELWRLDIERKYYRTYQGGGLNGTPTERFLKQMLNGRKKYQRRQFERDQAKYMGTKYLTNTIRADQIMFRCNTPSNVPVTPDYTLTIVPYSDMYVSVMYGNSSSVQQIRAKAGQECVITTNLTEMDDTAVLIYCASRIQALNDLSRCYIHDNDFSKAVKLKQLVIGSNVEGYSNEFLTTLNLGNNKLLERLDIRNNPNLTGSLNLNGCQNLVEVLADNTNITGVIFANGGIIKTAHFPALTSIVMKNLNHLTDFTMPSYDNLTSLIIENSEIVNTYDFINKSPNLDRVRLIGINWDSSYSIADTTILDRLYALRGYDTFGANMSRAVLAGYFYASTMYEKLYAMYRSAWGDLEIDYSSSGWVNQYTVTFKNDNGDILDVQYVNKGGSAINPITREDNPIPTPTKESSISENYTFNGWDLGLTQVFSDRVITATYTASVREYTIKYAVNGRVIPEATQTAPYGSSVEYTGEIPTYTDEEAAYTFYLFKGWDQLGYVDGDKTINAVFDRFTYSDGALAGRTIADMSPVEIYAILRMSSPSNQLYNNYAPIKEAITFNMGRDFDYDNVESEVIISEPFVLNGSNYIDTGIKLLDEDTSWVLALDYELATDNKEGATLLSCYQQFGRIGFSVKKSNSFNVVWGSSNYSISTTRNMIVLRHIKGEKNLHVYYSSIPSNNINTSELSAIRCTATNSPSLIIGCEKADDGYLENYVNGTIYWAKLWKNDIGESACEELASWTHESITMEVAFYRNYILSDGTGSRSSITFLAANALNSQLSLSVSSNNTGGWKDSSLRNFLNTRFYNALPTQWRQLIKQNVISSTAGGGSSDRVDSNDYIFVPSILEVHSGYNSPVYESECGLSSIKTVPYLTTEENRIRRKSDGTAVDYWTRSPNHSYDWASYFVKSDGSIEGYGMSSYEKGVVIMFSI